MIHEAHEVPRKSEGLATLRYNFPPQDKAAPPGEVPERLNGTVSKTVVGPWSTVGSNPTLSS